MKNLKLISILASTILFILLLMPKIGLMYIINIVMNNLNYEMDYSIGIVNYILLAGIPIIVYYLGRKQKELNLSKYIKGCLLLLISVVFVLSIFIIIKVITNHNENPLLPDFVIIIRNDFFWTYAIIIGILLPIILYLKFNKAKE